METSKEWKSLAAEIGPLRYQMSESDCAPTTVINALLLIYQRRLPTALVRMIWSLGADFDSGTGSVGTHMLAAALDVWFRKARADEHEEHDYALSSYIYKRDNFREITKTLKKQGVCCISISEGTHYVVLVALEEGKYLLFDPGWNKKFQSPAHTEEFKKYCGLANRSFTKQELIAELGHEYNKEVHILKHTE